MHRNIKIHISFSECLIMKQIGVIAIALGLLAFPAMAQNTAQVSSVQSGRSCAGCNLFQADLSYKELAGRTFAGARLRQSDFSLAVIDRVNFSRSDLSIANLYGVRATGANFSGANLANASLVGGYFSGASFRGANLSGADLSGAELSGARGLTQSQLSTACGDVETELPKGLRVAACK